MFERGGEEEEKKKRKRKEVARGESGRVFCPTIKSVHASDFIPLASCCGCGPTGKYSLQNAEHTTAMARDHVRSGDLNWPSLR